MQRAFVITLELPPEADTQSILDELTEALSSLPVIEINPWDSASSAPPPTTFPAL